MLSSLRLGTKFTVILILVFVGGIVISFAALSQALQRRAEDEVTSKGVILIQMMNSVRNYTSAHVNPLLAPQLDTQPKFISESVPAFSAREVFENLRKNPEYANFLYKEASPNPSNQRDKADTFEAVLVERFRGDDQLKEISGFRNLDGKNVFYSARPFAIKSADCLRCHGRPEDAPKSMVASYGSQNGFGWKMNEIVASQIIYVPADDVFNTARQSLALVMAIFVGIFALVVVVINVLLRRDVIRPIGLMARVAQRISSDEMGAAGSELLNLERVSTRRDELGQTAGVFRQMANEVYNREQRLKLQVQELRIEVDEARKARQVAEVTDSAYFRDLQKRAKDLRKRPTTPLPADHVGLAEEPGALYNADQASGQDQSPIPPPDAPPAPPPDTLEQWANTMNHDDGMMPTDLAKLPSALIRLVRFLLRAGEISYVDLSRDLAALPEGERMNQPELDDALVKLSEASLLIKTGEGSQATYRVNLRPRSAGGTAVKNRTTATLPHNIWTALDMEPGKADKDKP
ncbi:MAG: DUF3365 domain-containing protein [Anaerolineae bacterium]|nr:DUF3365 domain-containing protein [Anaerolineae bacterium]